MSRIPEVTVVVGAQWGDEGKGKEADYQAKTADLVIRANGGANAGHTVENHQGKFAMHLIPVGILNPDADNLIGNGVALSLTASLKEHAELNKRGISTRRLYISSKAQLTFPHHQTIDGLQEERRDAGKIGTTGTGNGPTYMDKAERSGIRAGVLRDRKKAMDLLHEVLKGKTALYYPNGGAPDTFNPEYYEELIREACEVFGEKVIDPTPFLAKHFSNGSRILVEGAHGALLDIDNGTYPYVTSSSCTVGGVLNAAEIPPSLLTSAIGVFKAFSTRVGEGPFVTELDDASAEELRKKGGEYGTTTGRPRRIGWFDAVASRYSQQINNFNHIVISKLDTLIGISPQLCYEYLLGNTVLRDFPSDSETLTECRPVYNEDSRFPMLKEDISGIRYWGDLPKNHQIYIMAVARAIGPDFQSIIIGTGPKREDRITLQ